MSVRTATRLSTVVSVENTMVCAPLAPLSYANMRCRPLTIEKINAEHPLPDITLNGQPLRVHIPVFNHESYFEHYRNESAKAMIRATPDMQDTIWAHKQLMKQSYVSYLAGELSENDFKRYMESVSKHIESLAHAA